MADRRFRFPRPAALSVMGLYKRRIRCPDVMRFACATAVYSARSE